MCLHLTLALWWLHLGFLCGVGTTVGNGSQLQKLAGFYGGK